jgi:hypothetical protein
MVLVGGIDDLVRHAPGPSAANESTRVHAGSLQLVDGIADGRSDLARLVNVPGEAADVIALAHRQHQYLSM